MEKKEPKKWEEEHMLENAGSAPHPSEKEVQNGGLRPKTKMSKRRKCKIISCCLTTIGSLTLIVIGVTVLVAVLPSVMRKKLKESLPFRNGTESGQRFIQSPVATYISFYVFNVMNMDEVNYNGATPVLEELGPYVYRQEKIKENLDWEATVGDRTSGLVSYEERMWFFYEPKKSKGSLSDEVNHVNVVSMLLARNPEVLSLADASYNTRRIRGDFIETHTVGELLFDGFSMKKYIGSEDIETLVCKGNSKCPFALNKNDTVNLPLVVSTGTENLDEIGIVRAFNGKEKLKYWYGDACNEVKGTDGKQFAPGIGDKDPVYVFAGEVCRSFKFVFEKKVVVQQIDALRFMVPTEAFEDPNINKENMCFCQNVSLETPCPAKAGVFSVEPCKKMGGLINVPIAMSAPHYYLGSEEYRNRFIGLNPTKDKHQTYIDVEPLTGTVISGAKRLQVNLIVRPGDSTFLKHVSEAYFFPVLWVEEGATIDAEKAALFRQKVTKPYKTGIWTMYSFIGVGGAVLLCLTLFVCLKKR